MSSLPYDLLGALERWPVLMATLSVAVCVALQWTKRREELGARVSQLGRRSLELVQWALACPLALRIVAVVRYQVQHPPEWDFLGFWLHGRSAVSGLDFYEPQSTRRMLGELAISDEFRREIVDVGFWYPPPSMFWFAPLGWFERGVALPYWYALQALAAVSSIGLLWCSFRRGGRSLELGTCVLLTLSCQATLSTFVFAQTTFLALAFYAAFSLVPERSWGGAWLALAALVKPPLALVALCSLPARRWRVGSTLLLTLGGLSLAAAGCWGVGTFLHYLRPTTVKPDWIFVEPTNQSLLGVVLRASSSSAPVSGPVAVYALLGLIVLTVTVRRLLELVSEGEGYGPLAFGLALSSALLVYPVSQVFYSLLLVPTWLWLLARARSVIIGAGTVVVAVPLCQVQEGHWTFVAVALTWVALVLESRAAAVAVSVPFEGEEAGQDAEVGVAA